MIKENYGNYHYLDIDKIHQQALSLWGEAVGKAWSKKIRKYNIKEKKENEQSLLQVMEKIEESKSKEKVKKVLKTFLLQGPIFSGEGKKIFEDPGFFISSEEFIRRIRSYDPEISKEDIGQALRNVWIMNLLQKSFNTPVVCTDEVFGYSMLYPYTDNFMDDPKIKREEKYLACEALERRLLGEKEKPMGEKEEKIHDMIGKIENTYSRALYPEVFESLLYIHQSQRESLRQQSLIMGDKIEEEIMKKRSRERKLETENLLEISFHKGGASVLADGYLVKGTLSEKEISFCFNYGVLLQMVDDLQDCKEDYENQHRTLFSMDYGKKKLDRKGDQLIGFAEKVFKVEGKDIKNKDMKNFLLENTLLLIFGAVLMNPCCFSEEYVQQVEIHFPVSRKFLETQQEGFKEKLKKQEQGWVKESLKVW